MPLIRGTLNLHQNSGHLCDYPCHHMISEQLGAQCSQALSIFHAYTECDLPSSMFSIVENGWNVLYVYHVTNTFVALTYDPTGLTTNSQNMACLEHQDCADVGPKLWLNPCQRSQKMAFHPWPEFFGLNTTNTACKRALMVAAFTKMISSLVPLYKAGNGMAGPRHGYLAWLSYLTLVGLLFFLLHCGCTVVCRVNCM